MPDQTVNYLNLVMSLLLSKIIVPTEFHEQATLVNMMLSSDTSGLVDSLTQFQVDCATVDINIDTESDALDETFNDWLQNINSEYRGQGIETGIRGLLKEYLKERWRGGSFPVLKITKWKEIDGMNLPISMVFAKGESIYAVEKTNSETIDLINYNYYLGKAKSEKIKGKAYLMYKLFVRWFDKYPTPYLIRRGVYKNWKLIDMIKNKEIELVDQIIPYLLLISKGNEQLLNKEITYTDDDLEGVKSKVQELINKLNQVQFTDDGQLGKKTPIRARNWDEEITHLIPDLKAMFQAELFASAEKQILAGLGFIDIANAVTSSRSESVLNPRPFIKECNQGITDFVNTVLKDLLDLIKEENPDSRKHNAKTWIVNYKSITEFMSEEFKTLIRSLSDRGLVSNATTVFICGGLNYDMEVRNRVKEIKNGDEYTMYPKMVQNMEDKGIDIQGEKKSTPEKKLKENIPEDKKGIEKKNFVNAMLEEDEEINDELVFSKEEELELAKWVKNRAPAQYYRFGQTSPDKFEKGSFKTIWLSESKGIKAVIGKQKGQDTTSIQSYLLDKEKFTKESASEWINKHRQGRKELTGAPYSELADLPPSVRKRLSIEGQRSWMTIWNSAYHFYLKKFGDAKRAETMAFKTAWAKAKNTSNAELVKSVLESQVEELAKKTETNEKILELELSKKKLSLLDRLLGKKLEG
jgi:cation transport regulator ChaB